MSSENVHFDTIPSSIRKPGQYLEFNTRNAVSTLPSAVQKLLIIAQRLAAGNVLALVPTQVFSAAEAADAFGSGSLAHLMVKTAIAENPYIDVTVCALDDAGGSAAATGTVTLAGTATAPGVLRLYVGNRRIEVAIATGDTAAATATSLNTALGLLADLPTTAGVAGAVVTLTARNKGTVANQVDLLAECTAAGISATVVTLANGSVDPDITLALVKVFAAQFDKIVTPYNDQTSLTALKTHLTTVSNAIEKRPGCGVYAQDAALASATTLAGQINDGRIVGILLRGTKSPSYEVAAAVAAIWAAQPDPAMPLNGLPLVTINAPTIDKLLSRTEQETCLHNGVAPLEAAADGTVRIVRLITTYTINAQGVSDVALLDATTITSLDYARAAWRDRIALRFPRNKITKKLPDRVRSELLDVAYKLEQSEILVDVASYKDQFIVEKDLQNVGQLNARIPAPVIPGLHVFAAVIDLYL